MLASFLRDEKEAAPEGRPKSREETPKEGCNIDTQRSMLRCTIYVALHNKPEGRSSQGLSCPSPASRMLTPDMKRPGAGPGLKGVSSKSVSVRQRGGPAWHSGLPGSQ